MSNTSQISANTANDFSENLSDPKKIFFSYAAKISKVNFTLLLEHFTKNAEDVFYYCEPEKGISFLSFEVLTKQAFTFDNYALLTDKIDVLKDKLVSNHNEYPDFNLPIFTTSVKFPVKRNSVEWSDFNDIDFIIPKIILFQHTESCFLISNFFSESFSHHENFDEFLEKEVDLIFELENRLTKNKTDRTSIKQAKYDNELNNWENQIESVIKEIKKENIEKTVIARRVEGELKSNISWQKNLDELNQKFPSCTNFLYKSGSSVFFGSTPEMLIKFSGKTFFTEALAGSIQRGKTQEEDILFENDLLRSAKNKQEHQAVIDFIKNEIKDYIETLEIDAVPVVKKLPNIQHLQTTVKGTLTDKNKMFKSITSLFPTPAVCGIPKDKSLKMIEKTESFDRGLFSGIIGWFNADNYGEFYVTIRSALVKENKLFAYAGCGIVKSSDPKEEFEETELKLKPILSLFDNAN